MFKFVVPQNYSFKNKIFGFIDYTTALVNVVWYAFIFLILRLFSFSIMVKISIFIILCFPLFLFSFLGFNNENIVYFLIYMIKFIKNRRIYFFMKDS